MIKMEKINLELGRIEGIGLGLGGHVGETLQLAADRIGRAVCEKAVLHHCADNPDRDPFHLSEKELLAAEKAVLGEFNPGLMTSGEVDELTDRLARYYLDHVEGKTQNFSRVCNDCIRAAALIEFLMEDRQRRDLEAYAGKP